MRAAPILSRVAALLCLLSAAAGAAAQERITQYRVEVDVLADGALEVTEHISAHAEGEQIRRGLYRDFPTRYRDRFGNAVVVDLEVIDLQRDGAPEPWFTENRDNGVRINFGNDDFLQGLPRTVEYRLRYRTTHQLGFFEGFDELYWNAIGTGWVFPIERASVEVRLPAPVDPARMQLDGYTGVQGAKGRDFVAEVAAPGVARWRLSAPLAPREGMTIVVGFPKGLVAEPSASERFARVLANNRGLLIALAGLVVLCLYCLRRWHQVGRDPRPGVIFARYEPPQGRSPAELRFLRGMGHDTRCLTADLVALAVAGRVSISREQRWLRRDLWTLQRESGSADALPETQARLLEALLPPSEPRIELKKSTATARRMQAAISAHTRTLKARLEGSHFKSNLGSVGLAALIGIGAGALAMITSGGHGQIAIIAVWVLMAVVLIVFAFLVRAPTTEGRVLLDEIEGLKLYLSVAERDELAAMRGPGDSGPPALDAQRYQQLLPYAIALGVEEAWTDRFTAAVGAAAAAEATRNIAWYHGGSFNSLGEMTQAVGSSLSSSIASSSSPPGSSSGGGGGGSSGGGGGGGGGGGR